MDRKTQRMGGRALGLFVGISIFCNALFAVAAEGEADVPFSTADLEFFEKEVRPILAVRCFSCHSKDAERLEGGLRLDSRKLALEGGDSGPAFVPGKPKESLLVDAINYGDIYQMPPKSRMPAAEVATLTRWIERGAPWPAEDDSVSKQQTFDLEGRRREFWAWQPIADLPLPEVKHKDWPRAASDYFLLAKMEEAGLKPAAPAPRHSLLRRVYFDLIGLPPTPKELAAFERDRSPQALESVVDRLLASPRFGERWGRHWLDLVRYAESRGHEFDHDAPNAWQYRDYVIRGLNADVPYDQWVKEHIAGDLLDPPRVHPERGFNESLLGTGFWFLGEWVHSPVSIRKDETDRFDNMIDTMSKTFLGMTVACARCHDHKFDAISQADYYALAGYLQSSSYRHARFESQLHNEQIAAKLENVRNEFAPRIAHETARRLQPGIGQAAAYLEAAIRVVSDPDFSTAKLKPTRKRPVVAPPREDATVRRIAGQQKLDAVRLAHWVLALCRAADDSDDPLHLFWQAASGRPDDAGQRLANLRDQWKNETQAVAQQRARTLARIDYRQPETARPWMPDGPGFGRGPLSTGQIVLSGKAARPFQQIVAQPHAAVDAAFSGLKLAPGTQPAEGRLQDLVRPGLMLKTPSFRLEQGVLLYRVQGAGAAYAVVDSHRLNKGPLHGQLIKRWGESTDGKPRWVAHDMRRYLGHHVHIEFHAPAKGLLAVYEVVEAADHDLVKAGHAANPLLQDLIATAPEIDIPALARGFADRLRAVQVRLSENRLAGQGPLAEGRADLANWLVQNPGLFISPGPAALGEAAREFAERYQRLVGQIQTHSHTAMAMLDGSAANELLLIRGGHKTPADPVPRRSLSALDGETPTTTQSGRLQLAEDLVAPDNPLVARVYVNRIWQHLFGVGIVPSVDNFGVLGQRPTHPELLDHLAAEFMRDGWSTKRLIRRLVLSSAYRMSSQASEAAVAIDPTNKWLSHARIRRLEGEAIRDALLAISGQLNEKMFGPSVPVHLTSFMQGRGRPRGGPLDGDGRRSIYISIRRNFLSPMMLAFDTPVPFNTMGRRNVSNVPAQALILLNDPLVVQQARHWAERIVTDQQTSTLEERVSLAYRQAFARQPTPLELTAALEFFAQQGKQMGLPAEQVHENVELWAHFCHVLFNVKDFIFID